MASISIETDRILDVEVLTPYYQRCINIEKFKENADLYEHLKLDQVCKSNHEGGKMKVVGVKRVISRSIETRRLCYIMGMEIPKVLFLFKIFMPQSCKQKRMHRTRRETCGYVSPQTGEN